MRRVGCGRRQILKRFKIQHDFSKFHLVLKTRVDFVQELLEIPELLWNKAFGVLLAMLMVMDFQIWQMPLFIFWVMVSIDLRAEKSK